MALRPDDLIILSDTNFFPARFRIAKELDAVLAELKDALSVEISDWKIPVGGLDRSRGKIFRGENYRQYPYQLLDFPRRFDSRGVFAFRSLCRWGNEWSFTLHLQGEGLDPFRSSLTRVQSALANHDAWWCINDTPWEYHFQADNYTLINSIPPETIARKVLENPFVKISRKLSLDRTDQVVGFGLETLRLFRKVLS